MPGKRKRPDPIGRDVKLRPRPEHPHTETYRVADDGTVYVACQFTNWTGRTNSRGVLPLDTWTQYRRMTAQQGPLAREARRVADLIARNILQPDGGPNF